LPRLGIGRHPQRTAERPVRVAVAVPALAARADRRAGDGRASELPPERGRDEHGREFGDTDGDLIRLKVSMYQEQPEQQTEFVLRRLSDSFQVGDKEVSPYLWLVILVPVLALGLAYVVWMYRRDCRSIRWPWAVFLGTLRAAVYLMLAGIFLLPAWQTWE